MILLKINESRYENDVRALVMAFYFGEKITTDESQETDKKLKIECGLLEVSVVLAVKDQADVTASGMMGHSSYRDERNAVNKVVYQVLCQATGKTLPWGTLTGIRPTKLAMELYEKGMNAQEVYENLRSTYQLSEEKGHLCAQVALREQKILETEDVAHSYSLYVGIPFCPSVCAYCSFSSYPLSVWQNRVEDYLQALFKEIEAVSEMFAGKKLLTFYMGGGTPTSLTADQMDRLLTKLETCFPLDTAREMTIEAGRPDSITREKLEVIKAHGIRRISINPQTMNQETLELIGRRHTVEEVHDAYALARAVGFDNINMDLIVGLPGETTAHVQRTMEEIMAMNPESVTVHSLALKRAAVINQERENYPVPDMNTVNEMIQIAHEGTAQIGVTPYYMYRQKNIAGNLENIGYAREGCEGLYNILIMEERQTILALGAGGSTKVVHPENGKISRIENVKSVKDYIERTDEMIARKAAVFGGILQN